MSSDAVTSIIFCVQKVSCFFRGLITLWIGSCTINVNNVIVE